MLFGELERTGFDTIELNSALVLSDTPAFMIFPRVSLAMGHRRAMRVTQS